MSGRIRLTKMLLRSGNPSIIKPQIREANKKLANPSHKWNIVRGDKVQVISRSHPEFGKQGIVRKVLRKLDRVIVEGVNMGPKRVKGDPERNIKGMIVQTERTIHYSNVNLVDPVSNLPTRVTRQYLEDGTKVRISKRSGAVIPKPDPLTLRRKPASAIVTPDDTAEEDVWEITYQPPKNTTSPS